MLIYTYPGYLSYSKQLSPPWYSGQGRAGSLDVVPSFPYPTLPYSTLHRSVYPSLPWCILPFSTPVPYHILPFHLYHRLLSSYSTPSFSNAPYWNWNKPAKSRNHSGPKRLTIKAESTQTKSRPKRPGLTNTGLKRPIFLKLVASFFSLYPNIVAAIVIFKQYTTCRKSICA